MTKSITVRGVTYPSQKAAAYALGVTGQTLGAANRRGTLDTVGLGPLQKGCEGVHKKPVILHGVEWASRAALAEHLGVSQSQLSSYFTVRDALHSARRA
jgi:hypothetical protein